jgi:hypothetical protein
MRARNELHRLSAAAPPVLMRTESILATDEEDRILERILGSPRPVGRTAAPPRRTALVFVGATIAVAAIAAVASGVFTRSTSAPRAGGGRQHLALTGVRIKLAGYHFRTPAGFKKSTSSCASTPTPSRPTSVLNGFAAAASADGGCIEAAYLIADQPLQGPPDAQPVDVGRYQGYFVSHTTDGKSSLFVDLPDAGGDQYHVSLVLLGQDLTEDQLIAVARSGLPDGPTTPAAVTGLAHTEWYVLSR